MSARRNGVSAAIIGLGAAAAAPVAASAATISLDRACYDVIPNGQMTILGSGFTPGDNPRQLQDVPLVIPPVGR